LIQVDLKEGKKKKRKGERETEGAGTEDINGRSLSQW
jgi:hypothetical protein